MYGAASARQQLTRAAVRKALACAPHGFTPLDACLIRNASLVNDAYDRWYVSWAKAVQVRRTASILPCNRPCRGLSVPCTPTVHFSHACKVVRCVRWHVQWMSPVVASWVMVPPCMRAPGQ